MAEKKIFTEVTTEIPTKFVAKALLSDDANFKCVSSKDISEALDILKKSNDIVFSSQLINAFELVFKEVFKPIDFKLSDNAFNKCRNITETLGNTVFSCLAKELTATAKSLDKITSYLFDDDTTIIKYNKECADNCRFEAACVDFTGDSA